MNAGLSSGPRTFWRVGDVLLQCLFSSSCALHAALSLGAAPEQALVPFPGFDCDLPLPPCAALNSHSHLRSQLGQGFWQEALHPVGCTPWGC